MESVALQPEQVLSEHPKLSQIVIDFEDGLMKNEEKVKQLLKDVDVVFCCLGTTRKAAKSDEAFKRVDYDYVAKIADIAKECGVKQFSLLTSVGADPNSKFLYLQTKGRVRISVHDHPLFHKNKQTNEQTNQRTRAIYHF
jgi:nucleoside-diphosphate-sugar epimerase